MKALVYEGPWQMPLRDVPVPEPGPGDVIVNVKAVGVCGSDVHGFTGSTGRRIPPMVMGHEFSGMISAVGEGVTSAQARRSRGGAADHHVRAMRQLPGRDAEHLHQPQRRGDDAAGWRERRGGVRA